MKVFDTCSLIRLYQEVKYPEALHKWRQQGYTLVIPKQVSEDIMKNTKTQTLVTEDKENTQITEIDYITEEELTTFRNRNPNLGNGECGVILSGMKLTEQAKRHYCITDDKTAKKIAIRYGEKAKDTRELINVLHEKGLIEAQTYEKVCERLNRFNY